MSLHFTAERSLRDRGRVVPQLTVTGCGSPTLNTACPRFRDPGVGACEVRVLVNEGAAGACMYWSMRGAAPFCSACTVVAP